MPDDFDSVYLDTEILKRANWPSESTELHNFLFLAKMLAVRIFIPEGAEMERQRGWIYDIQSEIMKLETSVARLSRWSMGPRLVDVPTADQLVRKYAEMAQSLKTKWGIETIPLTKRDPRELFGMAINRKPPFEEGAKGVVGFQDAVIYLSVLDHLKDMATARAAFVSGDKIFKEDFVGELARAGGAELKILPKLDELITQLKARLTGDPKRMWDLDVHSAELALKENRGVLQEFFEREFVERFQFGIAGENLYLESVHIAEIKNVQTPPLQERLEGNKSRLTFDVSATLHLTVVAFAESRIASENMRIIRNPERVVGLEAKVEAEALVRGDRYEDIKPLSIINAAAYYAPSSVLEYDEI